jgi:SAM-dependent methyltransferase
MRRSCEAGVSEADRQRWDARYAPGHWVMGARPKPLLLELETALPDRGRALDVACGEGQLALWLARRGLAVTAVDISEAALGKLRAQAAAEGLAGRIDAVAHDLDEGLPPVAAGLDLVTCIDFYAPAVLAEARALLAPGGLLLVEVLLQPPGGASPRRAAPGEALGFAEGLHLHFYREGVIDGRELAQLLAQRPPASLRKFLSG